jgi:hypothetical protein
MKVVSAAIKFYMLNDSYPTIMCGKRHADIFEKMYNLHIQYDKKTAIQGFLTDNNTFVDRYEAFEIARIADQFLPEAKIEYANKTISELYSEDVW